MFGDFSKGKTKHDEDDGGEDDNKDGDKDGEGDEGRGGGGGGIGINNGFDGQLDSTPRDDRDEKSEVLGAVFADVVGSIELVLINVVGLLDEEDSFFTVFDVFPEATIFHMFFLSVHCFIFPRHELEKNESREEPNSVFSFFL